MILQFFFKFRFNENFTYRRYLRIAKISSFTNAALKNDTRFILTKIISNNVFKYTNHQHIIYSSYAAQLKKQKPLCNFKNLIFTSQGVGDYNLISSMKLTKSKHVHNIQADDLHVEGRIGNDNDTKILVFIFLNRFNVLLFGNITALTISRYHTTQNCLID